MISVTKGSNLDKRRERGMLFKAGERSDEMKYRDVPTWTFEREGRIGQIASFPVSDAPFPITSVSLLALYFPSFLARG